MSVKRRRSEGSTESNRRRTDRDCYEEVLEGSNAEPTVSSWLRGMEWISASDDQSECVPMNDESLQEEIHSLSRQLSQVKRRLAPAAERCTEACNSFYNRPATTGRSEFVQARKACNPFEILGEGHSGGLNTLFMNRSAIKLANIDAIMDFHLACPTENGPFVFADLCGAPGGFSEYIIYRCKAAGVPCCQGYGMSLLGTNEHGKGTAWKLQDTVSIQNGSSFQYSICDGVDGTGDIFKWENVECLASMISQNSRNEGSNSADTGQVHLVVADGGFDAQRDSEHQEELTQKLVVCEVAAGLALLRRGGTLVVKMFGFQTSAIQALMKDLMSSFESLTAMKPISSRPASAERYVVCIGFSGNPAGWNAQRWRDRVFLSEKNEDRTTVGTDAYPRLEHYLDTFDRDLLSLNLKACFTILSFLENKCISIAGSQTNQFAAERHAVDVGAYKRVWRLASFS